MGCVWTIARRELKSFFVTPLAYAALTALILLSGYFFFNLLASFNLSLSRYVALPADLGIAPPNLNEWVIEPYFRSVTILLVFLVPILAMRAVAEDRRQGTFELLVTAPVSPSQIVAGKFIALAAIVGIAILLTFGFPLLLYWFGDPELLPALSGLLALLLCGWAFSSLALAVSSFTRSPSTAAVLSGGLLFLLAVIHSPAESLNNGGSVGSLAAQFFLVLSPVIQMQEMLRGVVASSSLVYFMSLIALGLFLAHQALFMEGWRGA